MFVNAHAKLPNAIHATFVRVAPEEWNLSDQLPARRRRQLQSGPGYEQIVAKMVKEASLIDIRRERARGDAQFFRAVITIQVRPSTLDLFHNSASGYRAQYYRSAELGIQANSFAMHRLITRIHPLLDTKEKRTCPVAWVEMSLQDPDAKVWLRQGIWLRHARRVDSNLFVARWMAQYASANDKRRKNAIRAVLTPGDESLIELKGGFITVTGRRLGSQKPERANDIHELGFT